MPLDPKLLQSIAMQYAHISHELRDVIDHLRGIERWELECLALGATKEQIAAYASTAVGRDVAIDLLKRGSELPANVDDAIAQYWLSRFIG